MKFGTYTLLLCKN